MSATIVYNFEWDTAKALTNRAKHGVTFDRAATMFLDALALTVYDEAHRGSEERWFTLGHDADGVLIVHPITHKCQLIV